MPPLPPLKKPRQAYLRLPPFVEAGGRRNGRRAAAAVALNGAAAATGPATTRVVVPADALPHRVLRVLVPAEDMDVVVGAPAPAPPPTVEEIRAAYQREQAAAPTAPRRCGAAAPRKVRAAAGAEARAGRDARVNPMLRC